MKNYIGILIAVFILTRCGNDESSSPSPAEQQLTKLTDTWVVKSVTFNDEDQDGYDGFTLTLTKSASGDTHLYSTSLRPPVSPWKESGVWEFGTDVNHDMIRDPDTEDVLPMFYTVSETELSVTFDFTGTGYQDGLASVEGEWEFVFERQ